MSVHDLTEKISEARRFYMAAPVIVPMLEKRHKLALQRLMGKYRDGETDYINVIAELYTLSTLLNEIRIQEQLYNELEKQNGRK